jgi:hypothetical protein
MRSRKVELAIGVGRPGSILSLGLHPAETEER